MGYDFGFSTLGRDTIAYQAELARRWIMFLDILRQRADDMLDHEGAGMPPLLDFEHETVLDARAFTPPANYMLLRVTGRGKLVAADCSCPGAPPVIIIDPRAGHGPGIGGFKQESEVGISLERGHPTYFVAFSAEPVPRQSLDDVVAALERFVSEVAARHPGLPPVLYGNCQGGWLAALLSATSAAPLGPAVMSGSPLSYWAGDSGSNPMRLAGGLLGGSWPARLASDLGNGRFDGAWLVSNFESLDPARSWWEKPYAVLADPDGQRDRFLQFERWWSGFHFLSREEIVRIVDDLFIGNRLEEGRVAIGGQPAKLESIRNPLVIFASRGDGITPPQQALGWIPAVYRTSRALKRAGQRIVYLLNEDVGHLGIFVSGEVVRLEHQALFDSLEAIGKLRPGLYEMKVLESRQERGCSGPKYSVRFEPRRVEDLPRNSAKKSFERVREISEHNAAAYEASIGPLVRATANPVSALALKWFHPMRVMRWIHSERINPWLWSLPLMLASWRRQPHGSSPDNPWMKVEADLVRTGSLGLHEAQRWREAAWGALFAALYARTSR